MGRIIRNIIIFGLTAIVIGTGARQIGYTQGYRDGVDQAAPKAGRQIPPCSDRQGIRWPARILRDGTLICLSSDEPER